MVIVLEITASVCIKCHSFDVPFISRKYLRDQSSFRREICTTSCATLSIIRVTSLLRLRKMALYYGVEFPLEDSN